MSRDRKVEKQRQRSRANVQRDTVIRSALRSRCSCGCNDSTPSSTGNSSSPVDHVASKPEVEISRSRNGVMTSQSDSRSDNNTHMRFPRVTKTGRVKPAIEMTRQQVLHVYVLNDRQTGSDVSSHVTRAPANRRAVSAASSGVSNFPARSRQVMASRVKANIQPRFHSNMIPDTVDAADRRNYPHGPSNSQPKTRKTLAEVDRPTLTVCCPSFPDKSYSSLSKSKESSLHKRDSYRPVSGTSSLDRRNVESSASPRKMFLSKTPTMYSSDKNFRLRPAAGIVSTASLDRQGSTMNYGRNMDCISDDDDDDDDEDEDEDDDEGEGGDDISKSCFAETNGKMRFKMQDDVSRRPSVYVGTTSSTSHSRTSPRHDDDRLIGTFGHPRRSSTTRTDDSHIQNSYQRKTSSLKREKDSLNCRTSAIEDGWTRSSRTGRSVKDSVVDDVDWANSRWIKRQIHLPVARQRRLVSSADVSQFQRMRRRTGGPVVECERSLVSSRTDPHNVCFSQRANGTCVNVMPARTTQLVYNTRADQPVCIGFTRDNNGNLLKVTNFLASL